MATHAQATKQAGTVRNGFIVLKVGGRAAQAGDLPPGVHDLVDQGLRPVVVHGGGAQLSDALAEAGVDVVFREGLRVTTDEVLDVATQVFAALGKRLAGAVSAAGTPAVALNGYDAGLLSAVPMEGLGRVGSMEAVDDEVLRFLAYNGVVPVVGPPALGPDGKALNVNADAIAAAVASALSADQLLLLTDVPAVLDATGEPIPELTAEKARQLSSAEGGMTPKLQAAAKAATDGVDRVAVGGAGAPLADLVEGRATVTEVTGGPA